jgi:hypothetical protein
METHLEVHVPICADEEALVLEPPFQLNEHRLSCHFLHEWLWVHWVDLAMDQRTTDD